MRFSVRTVVVFLGSVDESDSWWGLEKWRCKILYTYKYYIQYYMQDIYTSPLGKHSYRQWLVLCDEDNILLLHMHVFNFNNSFAMFPNTPHNLHLHINNQDMTEIIDMFPEMDSAYRKPLETMCHTLSLKKTFKIYIFTGHLCAAT